MLGLNNLAVNATSDNTSLNIVYDGKIYRLEELGAGIAQTIIVLGNILVKEPKLSLIDEPELNFHPQLQIRFLALVEKYCPYVVYSTHSLGLARSFSEGVFGLKEDSGVIKQFNINQPSSSLEFAGELYYGALSEIGCNKLLLVEGQTEVKILQHFLRELGKVNEFLVMPLYGRNQINSNSRDYLEELTKLQIPIHCIIDSEKTTAIDNLHQERVDFQTNCTQLGINLKILDRRAIENYLSDSAIKTVKGTSSRALTAFELLSALGANGWAKKENWRIASQMRFVDIAQTDLGQFIRAICT